MKVWAIRTFENFALGIVNRKKSYDDRMFKDSFARKWP